MPTLHRVVRAVLPSLLLGLALAGCRKSEQPTVVLYVSADEHIAREVIAAFEEAHDITVKMVGDTEAHKTTGLVERLRAEADNPQADVFWSSENFQTIRLAEDGILDEHLSEATVDWPKQWHDGGERRWFAFAARARVIAYAPDRVAAEDLPTTWMDLLEPRWKGRIVMADPRFGTTGGHLGAMKAYWDTKVMPGFYEAFLLGLADNQVRLLSSGNAGTVQAVVDGEADLGLTDTDDVWAARNRGYDVGMIFPRHDVDPPPTGGGTLLIPNTVARVRNGPNPEPAAVLIDFLLSPLVERMLAESVSHNLPLGPGLAEAFPDLRVDDPLRVDYDRAAAERRTAVEMAMDHLATRDG